MGERRKKLGMRQTFGEDEKITKSIPAKSQKDELMFTSILKMEFDSRSCPRWAT